MQSSCVRALRGVRFGLVPLFLLLAGAAASAQSPHIPQHLRDRAARDGSARVIVELGAGARAADVLAGMPEHARRVHRLYRTIPYLALDATPVALNALETMTGSVLRVMEDALVRPALADSAGIVQADQVWASGYDGSGTAIAVLDTGVDGSHPLLAGKVVAEACFSSTVRGESESFCPGGGDEEMGAGTGAPCELPECLHGTHVAGIAAGNGAGAGQSFSGIASGASLVAVQVFSRIVSATTCGGTAPCAAAYTSDILAGLEHVQSLALSHNVAAVNMSLGGSTFTAPCDGQPYKPAIDNLRSIGVATVVASGNSGATNAISTPACVSSAISVGATTKTDAVAYFSNVSQYLTLLAPGEAIVSSVPGGGYQALSGTSMAAPHVAGAFALARQAAPHIDVVALRNAFRSTGLPVTDTRLFGTATVPRIRIFRALAALVPITNPPPQAISLSPSRARAGTGLALAVAGSGFNAFSVVHWNGSPRPTTATSTTRVVASIPASDLPAAGTARITVVTPEPGGGTSGPLTFTIDPPPSLAITQSLVAPQTSVTATLTNGYGSWWDWLGLFPAGAPDTGYLQWTYVGSGVTDRTWTVAMPSTAGAYEFRLYVNDARAATSPPITVDPTVNPTPSIQSLSPAAAAVGGAPFTLTVSGDKFVSASVVRWNGSNRPTTFVSATQLRATIGAADIAAPGTALVSVSTPAPGGGESSSLTFAIQPPPALTVGSASVTAGASVTVTLTNGFGGVTDWLALAASGSPNNSYVQYVYVGTGITTRTWTVAIASPGTYEFRLFLNGGYTLAATSPAVTVSSASTTPPPGGSPALSVNATTVPAGAPITVTLTDGYGGGTDWLAFAATTAPNGSYLRYTYVGAGVTTRTWTVTAPSTPGTYEFRLFLNNGYTRAATSPPVTVQAPTTTPTLTVSATSVAPGTNVTVTLHDGYGGSWDWLSLSAAGSSAQSYLRYTYVGGGVTTRTWTVPMPTTPGSYEFRLYLDNSYTVAARSPVITVTQ